MSSAMYRIAIQQDDYTAPGKPPGYDAASPRWKSFLEAAGCTVRMVDVRAPDILAQLEGCDGFMWRWAHFGGMGRIARRLLPVIEREMGILTYPDQNTCWHYDDKIAQAWLFEAHGIPTPRTSVFFDRAKCLAWLDGQRFPLVMKFSNGASSENVILVNNLSEARALVEQSFAAFQRTPALKGPLGLRGRARFFVRQCLQGKPYQLRDDGYEPQAGYALFQEFIPNNDSTLRVTVIGNRAWVRKRYNIEHDFRVWKGGKADSDPHCVSQELVRLSYSISKTCRFQTLVTDWLVGTAGPLLLEISYTSTSGIIHDCPGHWELDGDPETGALRWVDGHMWPEQAQVEDFLGRLSARRR